MRQLLFLLLLALTLEAQAQIEDAEAAIADYRFFDAECMLADLHEGDSLFEEAAPLLRRARLGRGMMTAIERTMFIDSLIVPRKGWYRTWSRLPLSPTCGRLLPPEGKETGVRYQPEIGDRYYFSQGGRLFTAFYGYNGTAGKVADIEPLDIDMGDSVSLINPFMLADGLTLYFAATGKESLGGYDLFMTRYDTDERRFLKPQNIGMPFNSTGDDLFYAIDEENNLGYLVTARDSTPEAVVIYTFVPNEARLIYNEQLYGQDDLAQLARIGSISQTWTDSLFVGEQRRRLKALRQKK